MRISPRSARWTASAALIALVLAACGGSDTPAAGDTTTPATQAQTDTTEPDAGEPDTTEPVATEPDAGGTDTTEPTTTDAGSDDPSGPPEATIMIESVAELPDECVSILADLLRTVEPTVAAVDWTTASLDDLTKIMEEFEPISAQMDEDIAAAGCDQYEFADESGEYEAMLAVANEQAPGTVAWLNFIGGLSSAAGQEPTSAGPQTCDEAIAYLDALIAQGEKMRSLPISEFTTIQQAQNVISGSCDQSVASEFFGREDVLDFMS